MKLPHNGDVYDDGAIWSILIDSAPSILVVVVNVRCSNDDLFSTLLMVVKFRIVLTLIAWFLI